jgi:hypothetical protein
LDNQDRDAFLPQAIQLTIEAMSPTIAAATATAVKVMRRVDNVVQPLTYSSSSTGQYLSPAPSPQPPSPPSPNPFVITESIQSPRSWLPPNSPDWNYTGRQDRGDFNDDSDDNDENVPLARLRAAVVVPTVQEFLLLVNREFG